ncbi:MAG: hypothetical protein QOH93_821, partial [Chloroflexia bacterium]|nr:hypothetical protein [Chloroflexia bacterium]
MLNRPYRPNHPAPLVSCKKNLCANMNMTITGTVITTAPAISSGKLV